MKTILLIFACIMLPAIIHGQTRITGTITTEKGLPLANANIMIKNSYDGTSSDSTGRFSFTSSEKGKKILLFSSINYYTDSLPIEINGNVIELHFKLKERYNELDAVTITAGVFESGDSKKGAVLSSLDVATTAGATADIFSALQTLPGTQTSFSESGLFVRGGSASETKTFFDGMLVKTPFNTAIPDQASRGRFSPFLFKGTSFSAGGYSAQYGQALSSALMLESKDLPEKTTTALSVLSVGASADQTTRFKNSALTVGGFYYNLKPAFTLIKQQTDWDKAPEQYGGTLHYKLQTSKTGMFKWYSETSNSRIAIFRANPDKPLVKEYLKNDNKNSYINTSFYEYLGSNWKLQGGLSYSNNKDEGSTDEEHFGRTDRLLQGRLTLTNYFGSSSTFKFGSETYASKRQENLNDFQRHYSDQLSAGFAETDLYLTQKLVFRMGLRTEYSTYIDKFNVSPRSSLSYKTGKSSQVSLAYGRFYQNPDDSELIVQPLDFELADHYIANFQKATTQQTFRAEIYYKVYNQLTKNMGSYYNNSGQGYARGLDLFWRDKKSFKGSDYWISYSYLDTKRDFKDYPTLSVPPFAATHTLNVVYKKFFDKLNSQFGATYTFASGRTYINPNNPVYLSDKTKTFNNLSMNISYLTHIFKKFTVLYVSANNIPGFKNIYGYHYSADGQYRQAVRPAAARDVFVGLLMTIGDDSFIR